MKYFAWLSLKSVCFRRHISKHGFLDTIHPLYSCGNGLQLIGTYGQFFALPVLLGIIL